jgi:aryl-alcohol dehydrogenase-like predicted oxidoreductase
MTMEHRNPGNGGLKISRMCLGCMTSGAKRWREWVLEIEETLEAPTDVVRSGKALHIGPSSMYAWQFASMLRAPERHGYSRIVTMQNHYNLVYREEEREMIPLCRKEGIGLIPWSPLARGFLTRPPPAEGHGETSRAGTDDFAHKLNFRQGDSTIAARVADIAGKRGVSMAQAALAWILGKPGVTAPIIGASRMEQLEDLVKALDLELSPEERNTLETPYQPHPVLGHD